MQAGHTAVTHESLLTENLLDATLLLDTTTPNDLAKALGKGSKISSADLERYHALFVRNRLSIRKQIQRNIFESAPRWRQAAYATSTQVDAMDDDDELPQASDIRPASRRTMVGKDEASLNLLAMVEYLRAKDETLSKEVDALEVDIAALQARLTKKSNELLAVEMPTKEEQKAGRSLVHNTIASMNSIIQYSN